ncbi:hypothetical protein BVX99_02670 [bacterium F16]|nr:hypothetical protein BVX99_02670 [bacterium F16]
MTATIQETLSHMSNEAALVVDDDGQLVGIVTDGDLRRAFLKNANLLSPVSDYMTHNPFTVSENTARKVIHSMMLKRQIRHIPVVDSEYRPIALECFKYQALDEDLIKAVIMAGGKGTRLAPLTYDTPKPLLDFGDSTILDTILDGLHDNNINDVVLSVNYLREKIKDHVGDGSSHEMNVRYVEEEERMGTAGSLALLSPAPTKSFIVMNGDLITELDYRALAEFHRKHTNDITVCVRRAEVSIPYGVVSLDENGETINALKEKPNHEFLVNAGIYMLEPKIIELVPNVGYTDMTHLIDHALEKGLKVGAFPIIEYWRDVGQHHEMEKASEELINRKRKGPGLIGSVPAYLL